MVRTMSKPVSSSGLGNCPTTPRLDHALPWWNGGRVWFLSIVALLALIGGDTRAEGADGGTRRRTLAEDEIAAWWENKPVRTAAHRSYIFIDEEDIVEGTELPLYRIEASRYGRQRALERMVRGDRGLPQRIVDLNPELARVTEFDRRAQSAFYARRPGVSRDAPDPGNILGPLLSLLRSKP